MCIRDRIQQANTKIDEIRSGFTDWLCDQSADFKERLADMYNLSLIHICSRCAARS